MKVHNTPDKLIGRSLRGIWRLSNKVIGKIESKKPIEITRDILHTKEDMIKILLKLIDSRIIECSDGSLCYRTKLHSTTSYTTLAQERLVLSFLNLYRKTKRKTFLTKAIKLGTYLKGKIEGGILQYHKPFYHAQDEGVATYWGIPVFVELYTGTLHREFLTCAIELGDCGREKLYQTDCGYVHTIGQEISCTNVSAVAAYSYTKLYDLTGQSKYLKWIEDGLTYSAEQITAEGVFPYSEEIPTVYITLYHATVLLLLAHFLGTPWDEKFEITDKVKAAANYLEKLVRTDGSVKEPDLDYYSYLTSVAVTATTLSKLKSKDLSEKVMKFLGNFFIYIQGGLPFLFISHQKKLSNGWDGSLRDHRDALMTETLYYITSI